MFFGDCREHEVLLNILTQLFLKKFNLYDKYRVRKLYAKGITIANNTEYMKTKDTDLYRSETRFNYKTGGYFNESVSEWEHTHPVLYDVTYDKLYSIDAVRYKTKWNPFCDSTNGIELIIINLNTTDKNNMPYVHYKNMVDKEIRTYIEIPTHFSNSAPLIRNNKNISLLYGFPFDILSSTLFETKKNIDYARYRIIDVQGIEEFNNIIKLLCLKRIVSSLSRARSLATKSKSKSKSKLKLVLKPMSN